MKTLIQENDMTVAEPVTPALYSKEYFIAKFSAIPEEFWITAGYENKFGGRCAMGLCGESYKKDTNDSIGLRLLTRCFSGSKSWLFNPAQVNDGEDERYQQPTPKARILAALRDLP